MGDEFDGPILFGCGREHDNGPGVESYSCDGCHNDGFSHMGCGDCPNNDERVREYNRKYVY
jgi:hypothetical protein